MRRQTTLREVASAPTRRHGGRAVLAVALLTGLILTSCPNPLPTELATQVTDGNPPLIVIESPAEGATYQSAVTVTGTANDREGSVALVNLRVPTCEVDRPVEIDEEGAFSTCFSTAGVSSSVTLTVTATDWNGNQTSASRVVENDLAGPHIRITEPADYSSYATVVRVSGSITDAAGAESCGEVSACSYRIPGTAVAGDLEIDETGAFSFEFVTRNPDGSAVIDGSASIEVTAVDYNDNENMESITIVKSATGDFSSVTVTPANKQVTIEWEPVLHAESYSIFESKYGRTRTDVVSPYVWDELENGEIYRFQIKAEIPADLGEDVYSSNIERMPLSARSFAPWIREIGYRSITVEWWDNPNVTEYTVERSSSLDGPWEVRRNLATSVFTDTEVEYGTEYHSGVIPVRFPEICSASTGGVPARFTKSSVTSILT